MREIKLYETETGIFKLAVSGNDGQSAVTDITTEEAELIADLINQFLMGKVIMICDVADN